ncbi:MAG: Coenzyme F420 hydrogenase/dehydrogenase, beta subunit C-terminal domain [Promethearchaeota archaeon]|nr:MAG: Coenzyme F420 hydrogenase/dehydrogenase, beta subunit C-terminal domain [Candidatus Lokiarchaeota archaeon]
MITKEQMIDYLQCDISSFGFQDLHDLVISKESCINCGACLALCPRIGINENGPKLIDYDPECSLCYKYCPKTFFPKKLFEEEIFKNKYFNDRILGNYQKILAVKSTDNKILQNSQNGGVVTTLLCHAINTGLVDGVLMAKKDENWHPEPFVATSQEEIISAAGSIYAMVPLLRKYYDVVYKYEIENIAFVGLPCQIHAVRKFQLWPPLSDKYGKFKIIIGLFCSSNYSYDSIFNLTRDLIGCSFKDIKKFDVSHGKFISYLKDGSIREISVEKTNKYHHSSCKYCKDYTAKFADISIGSVGAPDDNWNSVIIRSDLGKKLFDSALRDQRVILSENIEPKKIMNVSKRKKLQLIKTSDDIYDALKIFNMSKSAVEIYTTLLSLGEADLYTIKEVVTLKLESIFNILNTLRMRKWIIKNENSYRPISPSQVIKNEINELMSKFQNKIDHIKKEILENLNTIFLQNNLMELENLDFMDMVF